MNHSRRKFIRLRKYFRERPKITKVLKLAGKLLFTVLALYIVFQNIEIDQIWKSIKGIPVAYFLSALMLYVISQVISVIRLHIFLQAKSITINLKDNLRLYFRAMFYNLLLPGGIGGDGYKIMVLKSVSSNSYKDITLTILLDRLSGGIALIFLALLFAAPVVSDLLSPFYGMLLLVSALLTYPIAFYFTKVWLEEFRQLFGKIALYAFLVQFTQLCCAFALFTGLGITENQSYYFAFFLVSSVFTFIPFTIGGVGARELVFILASKYTLINGDQAVAFAILFSTLTLLSSLPGFLISNQSLANSMAVSSNSNFRSM